MTTVHSSILSSYAPTPHITGEQLKFLLDGTGVRLSELEGRISAIAGINGQGRILNPRFPVGDNLGVLRARLGATINSDCHIKDNGSITYYENDPVRIDRVQQALRAFGDITLYRSPRNEGGHYETVFPRSIGRAFVHWGFTIGDKPILNRGLPEVIRSGTLSETRAYFEDLIPQDGQFKPHSGFSWARSVVLDAGTKNEAYDFKPRIQVAEIEIIKEHGTAHWEERGLVCLPTPVLRGLIDSDDLDISSTAALLKATIRRNPSRLLNDEVRLVKCLGIQPRVYVKDIVYSNTTKRVSVCWVAETHSKTETIRFALLCPPNDLRTNSKVNDWLSHCSDEVGQIREQLRNEGFRL